MNLRTKIVMKTGASIALTMVLGCTQEIADDEPEATTADEINSAPRVYVSDACEPFDDTTYQLRRYELGAKTISATWVRYADAECSPASKLATIVMSGSANVTSLSAQVLGAVNISVHIAEKTILPESQAGVDMLATLCAPGRYAFEPGVSQAVTTGCGPLLQQDDDCPTEYDLLRFARGERIFYGDRSRPLCRREDRPRALSAYAVHRE